MRTGCSQENPCSQQRLASVLSSDIDVHVIARRHVPDDRAVHAGEDGIAESQAIPSDDDAARPSATSFPDHHRGEDVAGSDCWRVIVETLFRFKGGVATPASANHSL